MLYFDIDMCCNESIFIVKLTPWELYKAVIILIPLMHYWQINCIKCDITYMEWHDNSEDVIFCVKIAYFTVY